MDTWLSGVSGSVRPHPYTRLKPMLLVSLTSTRLPASSSTHTAWHRLRVLPDKKSYHAELEICGLLWEQDNRSFTKPSFAIIVIGIDDCKGLMDNVLHAESPGRFPRPVCGLCKAARKIIQLLISICHISNLLDPITDDFLEILLKILSDDKTIRSKPASSASLME